jgi:hypothetical protein
MTNNMEQKDMVRFIANAIQSYSDNLPEVWGYFDSFEITTSNVSGFSTLYIRMEDGSQYAVSVKRYSGDKSRRYEAT